MSEPTSSLDGNAVKPTYEQLEFMVKQRERELDKARELIRDLKEILRREKLVLRGMVDEHYTLRVCIDPMVLSEDAFGGVQAMLKAYVGRTVGEIEEKLGKPLRRLQEALMHIHYIENHARSRGLEFTPFERRAGDNWLYY